MKKLSTHDCDFGNLCATLLSIVLWFVKVPLHELGIKQISICHT